MFGTILVLLIKIFALLLLNKIVKYDYLKIILSKLNERIIIKKRLLISTALVILMLTGLILTTGTEGNTNTGKKY